MRIQHLLFIFSVSYWIIGCGHSESKISLAKDESDLFSRIQTTPDGDCFFHALITEPEEEFNDVKKRITELRERLYQHYLQGNNREDIVNLIYEEYIGNHDCAPKHIRTLLNENQPLETIKPFITDYEIERYVSRYRQNRGVKSYIPARQDDLECPAKILAKMTQTPVIIYTYNKSKQKYDILTRAINESENIVHILLDGGHYTRLITKTASQHQLQQAIQISKNSNYYINNIKTSKP